MPTIIEITDLSNEALSPYCRLTEAQLRAKQSPDRGLFIAEGVKVIEHALDAGCEPVSLLMPRRHAEGKAKALIERCGAPVYVADEALLQTLTGYALTRGVWPFWRTSSIPPTWARSCARPPRWAWTPRCSRRAAAIPSAAAPCA